MFIETEILKKAFENYLLISKASVISKGENIYTLGWYIQKGMSIISPHPHRHYTFLEFCGECEKRSSLYEKMILPLL